MFDWHPEKSERTFQERGFNFAYVARIFVGHTLEKVDSRFYYEGEERILALGRVEDEVYVVVFTWRHDPAGTPLRWIISARRANRNERKRYAAFFPG